MMRDSRYRSLESVGQTSKRLANPPLEELDALVAPLLVSEGPGRQRPGILGKRNGVPRAMVSSQISKRRTLNWIVAVFSFFLLAMSNWAAEPVFP